MSTKSSIQYFLAKTEPETYSIDQLALDRQEPWTGVRNYQARNVMQTMNIGDLVLIYHSNAKPSAIVGLARVVRTAYPDFTAFDKQSPYYDPKSDPTQPRWWMVDLAFVEKFTFPLSLETIKADQQFADLFLVTHSRLSVQPVPAKQFHVIMKMVKSKTVAGNSRGV